MVDFPFEPITEGGVTYQTIENLQATFDAVASAINALGGTATFDAETGAFETRASASIAVIAAGVKAVIVKALASTGDRGAGIYHRVASEPAHALKFRSADTFLPDGTTSAPNGGWWEWGLPVVTPFATGGVGNGVTNDAAAIIAVNDSASPAKLVDLAGRNWEYSGTFSRDSAITFVNGTITDDSTTHDFSVLGGGTFTGDIVMGTGAQIIAIAGTGPAAADVGLRIGSLHGFYTLASTNLRLAVNGALAVQFDEAGSTASAATTAITREKGDARYQIAGGILIAQHQQTAGTNGGTPVASTWTALPLTEAVNTITGASVSSNQITLPAGTYQVRGTSPIGMGGSVSHKCRLRNLGTAATELVGSSERNGGSGAQITTSHLFGQFTIAVSRTFEFQYWTNVAGSNLLGQAANAGEIEVYAQIQFEKVS